MTVSQALVTFLTQQWSVDGAHRERTIAGIHGIFGHGNVAGIGQAIAQLQHTNPGLLPYHQARNEQAMVHRSVGYARMRRRLGTYASTASVGPGATNMLTGAALATTNRLPALLLPSDTFATRVCDPVLQQLELPHDTGISVNDAFRPLSKYFDRVQRPEQLYSIALAAMRVLTDPAETGAVTIALPEDVQTEILDVPRAFLEPREWHLRRPLPEPAALKRAVQAIRQAKRPLIIAGGGVIYSRAETELRTLAAHTGIPVGTTQAGGGAILWDDPNSLGGIGATGTTAANRIAAEADIVIGIGTRYSDFTTASRTAFQHPNVQFVNINIAAFDAYKHGTQHPIIADAKETLTALHAALADWHTTPEYQQHVNQLRAAWFTQADNALAEPHHNTNKNTPKPADTEQPNWLPSQSQLIGAIHRAVAPEDVIVQAAGSLPGDLHKLWRVRDSLGYHVEYAYSCMGYEIAGGLGVKMGAEADGSNRDVIVMVGDGSYLMLHTELVTAVAENLKIIVVLVQNHGYASIGHLSETVGTERFGTAYHSQTAVLANTQDAPPLPIDLAANARSYGIPVIAVTPGPNALTELSAAITTAKAAPHTTLIHVQSDPRKYAPSGDSWWEVPVAPISAQNSTQNAHTTYLQHKATQRPLLG